MKEPTITNTTTITEDTGSIKQNNIYYFNTDLSGKAVATDTHGLAGSNPITISINDVTDSTVTPDENGDWSIAADKFTAGTTQIVTVTATDKVGKSTTKTFNVQYDNSAPVVTVQTPISGAQIADRTVTASGTIAEIGIGLDTLQYKINNDDWTNINVTAGSTTWQAGLDF